MNNTSFLSFPTGSGIQTLSVFLRESGFPSGVYPHENGGGNDNERPYLCIIHQTPIHKFDKEYYKINNMFGSIHVNQEEGNTWTALQRLVLWVMG